MTSAPMREALGLALRARGRTHPNPLVGAVVVKDGRVVGRGYHHRAGDHHAEVLALADAGSQAQGSTLYVTLEPCRHVGRTPPCTDAIIAAGVGRVVAAVCDPNPRAAGGLEVLTAAGVEVELGDGAAEAFRLNLPYLSWIIRGRPWVTLKSAMSADGRVATVTGASRYLTGERARRHVHRLRDQADAIVVGVGTALADDPALTCRGIRGGRDPVRVVLDSRGRLSPHARLFNTGSAAPTLVYTLPGVSSAWERAVGDAGGQVVSVAEREGHVDLEAVVRDLGERDLLWLLVEGGPRIHAALLDQGLADAWIGYWAPLILGGPAPGPVGGEGVAELSQAVRLTPLRARRLGPDVLVEGEIESSWKELALRCLPESSRMSALHSI